MEIKNVEAIIERAKDGTYSIYTDADELGYLITGTGKTVTEAKRCFEGGYSDMKRYYEEEGKAFQEIAWTYRYDMISFLAYYSNIISLAGLSRLTGINPQQLSHYATGRRNPSPKTLEKIETALHDFSQDLASFSFAQTTK